MRRLVLLALGCVAALVLATGFPVTASAEPGDVKWVPARHVRSLDGAVLYDAYCAVCHGRTGRGNGPAAGHLAVAVPDLSRIAERDGRFRDVHVQFHVVSTPRPFVAMPDWKEIFSANFGSPEIAKIAVYKVTTHVASLQVSNGATTTR